MDFFPPATRSALDLAQRYRLSFYDALMLTVALNSGSTRNCPEDLHDGLVVEGRLTVVNAFRAAPQPINP